MVLLKVKQQEKVDTLERELITRHAREQSLQENFWAAKEKWEMEKEEANKKIAMLMHKDSQYLVCYIVY